MWVAEGDGRIVGFLASFPTRMKLLHTDWTMILPCDLMVSPDARRHGLGGKLINLYIEAAGWLANGLVYSKDSGRIFTKLGYHEVDAHATLVRPYSWNRVLDFVLSSGSRPGILKNPPVKWGLMGVAACATLFSRLVNTAKSPSPDQSIEVTETTSIGSEFDTLWNDLSPSFPIIAVRDQQYVQWRFLDDPNGGHTLLVARSSDGSLLGYVDACVSTRRGLQVGRIMDLFCSVDRPDVVVALMDGALRVLEARKVAIVSCMGLHPKLRATVRRFLYLKPERLQLKPMFKWLGDPAMQDDIYDADNWHLSHADGDEGFAP